MGQERHTILSLLSIKNNKTEKLLHVFASLEARKVKFNFSIIF